MGVKLEERTKIEFDHLCHCDDGDYIDFELIDNQLNSERRVWHLTFVKGELPFASKRVSETDESEFSDGVQVSDKMCDFIIQHLSIEANKIVGRERTKWGMNFSA